MIIVGVFPAAVCWIALWQDSVCSRAAWSLRSRPPINALLEVADYWQSVVMMVEVETQQLGQKGFRRMPRG